MDLKTPLLIFLCVAYLFPVGSGLFSTVIGIYIDVVELGLKVVETTNKLESEETPSDLSELIAEINTRIDTSTTDIITSVTLQSKLYRVEDAVISIHNSLIDLKNIIQATTKQERDEYKRLFVSRFEQHEVIKHLRFLPQLLEYNIPGTTGKLVDLFADKCRCNMTAINDFKMFYIEMISDGISLQLPYLRFSANVSLNKTLENWSLRLVKIAQTFHNQETTCVSKFLAYAEEDVQNADNALKLWTDNKERYTWKNSDVMFLNPYKSYQFLYYLKADNCVFWSRSEIRNKFAIFTDKNDRKPDFTLLKIVKGNLTSYKHDERDENTAKNVGIAVENYLKEQGYAIKCMVVFFDGGEFSPEKIIVDKDSPVLQMSRGDVKLIYKERFTRKSVNGHMKIFAYVANATVFSSQHRETGPSARNEPCTILVYFLFALCIENYFRTK